MSSMSRRGTRGSRRVTVLTAALLCVAVGAGTLAGCSSNNEPEPLSQDQPDKKQEPAPEPEPTEDQTSDGPELPDKLDGDHVRFVLAYYEEYNKATQSGNTDELRAMAKDDCVSCNGMADQIDDVFANGGHYEGRLVPLLDEEKNLARLGDDTANVTLRFERKDSVIHPGDGQKPMRPSEQFVDMHVNLVQEGDTWAVDEFSSKPVRE